MIVVVIMAILVAVAVPVYSIVTANARKRVCIANQREIVSQLTSASMNSNWKSISFSFTVTTNANADGGTFAMSSSSGAGCPAIASLRGLFSTVPYCPVEGSVITVQVAIDETGRATQLSPSCTVSGHTLVG